MERIRIEQHSVGGLLWVAGWLFTIGYLQTSGRGARERSRPDLAV
jgi:hypothetical protein